MGKFGPTIQAQITDLETHIPFLKIVCSSSGRLTKELISIWIHDCLLEYLMHKTFSSCLLLMDSWSEQWNQNVWSDHVPESITIVKEKNSRRNNW